MSALPFWLLFLVLTAALYWLIRGALLVAALLTPDDDTGCPPDPMEAYPR